MDATSAIALHYMSALSGTVEGNMAMGYRYLHGIGTYVLYTVLHVHVLQYYYCTCTTCTYIIPYIVLKIILYTISYTILYMHLYVCAYMLHICMI